MLGEYAPVKRRGLVSASVIGLRFNNRNITVASLVWLIVLHKMDKDDLLSWGWRISFSFAAFLLLLQILIRRRPYAKHQSLNVKALLQAEREKVIREEKAQQQHDGRSFTGKRTRAFLDHGRITYRRNGPSYLAQGFIIGYVLRSTDGG